MGEEERMERTVKLGGMTAGMPGLLRGLWVLVALCCACWGCGQGRHVPDALESLAGLDGSQWERVSTPGFGDDMNAAIVAMHEYRGRLYALVRNDDYGAEVWRTSGSGWEQMRFPGGAVNGLYGNHMINSHMGAMIVFQDKLYCGFSSGIQGNYLKSSGCEVWRYDGMRWEPVISDRVDKEERGTITEIAGCADQDGDTKAQIVDSSKRWTANQWAGGVLQITSGDGAFRRFDIVGNTADTLTVQQNEIAGELGTEFSVCEGKHYVNPFPPHEYDLGRVASGDIGNGTPFLPVHPVGDNRFPAHAVITPDLTAR